MFRSVVSPLLQGVWLCECVSAIQIYCFVRILKRWRQKCLVRGSDFFSFLCEFLVFFVSLFDGKWLSVCVCAAAFIPWAKKNCCCSIRFSVHLGWILFVLGPYIINDCGNIYISSEFGNQWKAIHDRCSYYAQLFPSQSWMGKWWTVFFLLF